MAVFRIEKTKDYTVMSNFHLRDRSLTLKGKGLLSLMLSLPESWDYTMKGLASICPDGLTSVRSGIKELEEHGYLIRCRIREANGQLGDIEYTILEIPRDIVDNPSKSVDNSEIFVDNLQLESGKPISVKPTSENPTQAMPVYEERTQLITKESSIKKALNTHESNIHQSIRQEPPIAVPSKSKEIDRIDRMDVMREYREILKENIAYDILCEDMPRRTGIIGEILELMLDTVCSAKKTIRISGEDKPSEAVKSRMLKLDDSHIRYVLECLDKNTTDVRNIKSYLLTTLYNAPVTIDNYYKSRVNHDFRG
jgi:hypothetical protein